MKRILAVGLLLALVLGCVGTVWAAEAPFQFLGATWGMSPEQVKKLPSLEGSMLTPGKEDSNGKRDGGKEYYTLSYMGQKIYDWTFLTAEFGFDGNDELCYSFGALFNGTPDHYKKLKQKITADYGELATDEEGIRDGGTVYEATWELDDAYIYVRCFKSGGIGVFFANPITCPFKTPEELHEHNATTAGGAYKAASESQSSSSRLDAVTAVLTAGDKIGNWPEGKFFQDFVFFPDEAALRQSKIDVGGWTEADALNRIAGKKPYVIGGQEFSVEIRWSALEKDKTTVFLETGALEQMTAVSLSTTLRQEISKTWGAPSEKFIVDGKESEAFSLGETLGSDTFCAYGFNWAKGAYEAFIRIINDPTHPKKIRMTVSFSGLKYDGVGQAEVAPVAEKAPASASETAYFRQTQWGMTKEQVKASEAGDVQASVSDSRYLILDDVKVAGALDAMAFFQFDEANRLFKGSYLFANKHEDRQEYITDYQMLRTQLTEKYGAPVTDEENWENDVFKDRPKQYGLAVSLGYLTYLTIYQVGETEITLYMSGEDDSVSLMLTYEKVAPAKTAPQLNSSGL